MEPNVLQVECPETTSKQVVEVRPEGGISWCSRFAANPNCAQTCIPTRLRGELPQVEAAVLTREDLGFD